MQMDPIMQKRLMELEQRLKNLVDNDNKGESSSSSSNTNNVSSNKSLEGEIMPFPAGFDQWSKEKQTSYMAAWLQTKSKPKVYNSSQKREIMLYNKATGEYFPEVKEQIMFGNVHLKVIPQDCKFAFNTTLIIRKEQKVLVDNLYQSSLMDNKSYKIISLNALCNYFYENNEKSNAHNRYPYYVVVHGKKTGVFCSWPNMLEAIHNTTNPKWSGFHNKFEAFDFARNNLGSNYYIDPSIISSKPQYNVPSNEAVLCKNCNKLREQVLLGTEYSSLVKEENESIRKENEELKKYADNMEKIVKEMDERYNELEESYNKLKKLSIGFQSSVPPTPSEIITVIKEEFKKQQTEISQTLQKELSLYFPEHQQLKEDDNASMEDDLGNFMEQVEKDFADVNMTK